jgi:hypothetical protein
MKWNIFRKYLLRMVIAFTGYTLGLIALNRCYDPQSAYRFWLILLPVMPLIYMAATSIRAVSEYDEMKRKIVTEAMAFSGLATGFTSFSYLFVRDMGAWEFRPEWGFYLMWAYYFIGLFFSWRRYR